jgi:hypothetical protein
LLQLLICGAFFLAEEPLHETVLPVQLKPVKGALAIGAVGRMEAIETSLVLSFKLVATQERVLGLYCDVEWAFCSCRIHGVRGGVMLR